MIGAACADRESSSVTHEQCELLQARSLDWRVPSSIGDPAIREAHRRQLATSIGAGGVEWCLSQLSSRQIACALAAQTSSAFDACLPVAEFSAAVETEAP
jgi:hypothetical protein